LLARSLDEQSGKFFGLETANIWQFLRQNDALTATWGGSFEAESRGASEFPNCASYFIAAT